MKRLCFSFSLLCLFFSCSSEESTLQNEPESNFYALTVGNSWVYKYYAVLPEENIDNFVGITDSISIVSTEEINGKSYYKFESIVSGNVNYEDYFPANGTTYKYFRDSLGYLVDEIGTKYFTSSDFEEWLYFLDPFTETGLGGTDGYAQLQPNDTIVSVEAGEFECLEMIVRYINNNSGEERPFKNNVYYSDEIGLISKNFGFVSMDNAWYECRLDSYIIN